MRSQVEHRFRRHTHFRVCVGRLTVARASTLGEALVLGTERQRARGARLCIHPIQVVDPSGKVVVVLTRELAQRLTRPKPWTKWRTHRPTGSQSFG